MKRVPVANSTRARGVRPLGVACFLAVSLAAAAMATERWGPPEDWLVSCDGDWVYAPREVAQVRSQTCSFVKLAPSGAAVAFHVTVIEDTSMDLASLSMGDGFLIELGTWVTAETPQIELILGPVDFEKPIVEPKERSLRLTPHGRHLIDERTKLFLEPLALRYPSQQNRLRTSVVEWICGDPRYGENPATANPVLRRTAGCPGTR